MTQPLFREEARQALKVRLEGEVVALTPASTKTLAAAFGIFAAALAIFGSVAEYTRYVPAAGVLAPKEGLLTVSAPLRADVQEILVAQGDAVRAGQALALLRNTQAQEPGKDTYEHDRALLGSRVELSKQLQQARLAEVQANVQAAEARGAAAHRTLDAAKAALQSAEHRVGLAKTQLERQRTLVDRGYLASAGLAPYEQALADAVHVTRQAQQSIAAQTEELVAAQQAVSQARSQAKTLALQGEDSRTSLALEGSRLAASAQAIVSSSVAGTVVAVPARKGAVASGAPLFVVAPSGPVYAHLVLSEPAAQRAKVGQRVSLQVAARTRMEAKKLDGVVESVASAPTPVPTERGTEQGYAALVLLDEQSPAELPPLGARVEARLQTQTKTILGWLVDPLARGLRQTNLSGSR